MPAPDTVEHIEFGFDKLIDSASGITRDIEPTVAAPESGPLVESGSIHRLGYGGDQGNVEFIPPGKDRSDRSNIIYFPNGYKEVEGPFSQRYEVSTTQETVVAQQVQNPVKGQTPI